MRWPSGGTGEPQASARRAYSASASGVVTPGITGKKTAGDSFIRQHLLLLLGRERVVERQEGSVGPAEADQVLVVAGEHGRFVAAGHHVVLLANGAGALEVRLDGVEEFNRH